MLKAEIKQTKKKHAKACSCWRQTTIAQNMLYKKQIKVLVRGGVRGGKAFTPPRTHCIMCCAKHFIAATADLCS